jgi:hypothetical protein
MTRGNGKKSAETIRNRYTPEQIHEQKAKGGKVSTPGGFGYMKKHDPERFKKIIAEREARRKAKT